MASPTTLTTVETWTRLDYRTPIYPGVAVLLYDIDAPEFVTHATYKGLVDPETRELEFEGPIDFVGPAS